MNFIFFGSLRDNFIARSFVVVIGLESFMKISIEILYCVSKLYDFSK